MARSSWAGGQPARLGGRKRQCEDSSEEEEEEVVRAGYYTPAGLVTKAIRYATPLISPFLTRVSLRMV